MSVYNNLESIRKLSNSSLTSIIDVTNLNFKSLSEGTLEFLTNVNYDEVNNSISLYKGTYEFVDISNKISLKLDGIPTFTIDSLGRAEGQEILVKVSEAKRRRFTDFTDWPDEGVPGEIIYTGIQNQKPQFGEDFIGYLDGRGWVSLTTLNNPVPGLPIIPETGSPLVLPIVTPGTGLLWLGPPGYENEYEPQDVTLYFSDDDGNVFDILTDPIWEKIGDGAKYKLTDELVIGDSINNGILKYVDGNQQAGYILTSDSQGYASWQPNAGGGGGGGATNVAYVQIVDFTQDIPFTINHNLGSDSIHIQLIDLDGNEIVEGHFDNYTINTVDVTLTETNNNVKVVIFAAGGVEITSLEQLTDTALTSPLLDGDILIYDETSGFWVNSASSTVDTQILTPDDKFLTALNTTADGDPASLSGITNTPVDGCYVEVKVNGVEYEVGNGVTTKTCYFASPASPTVPKGFSTSHPNGQVSAGDLLYWNGSIIGFELKAGSRISLTYLTSV